MRTRQWSSTVIVLTVLLVLAAPLAADVKLPTILGDNMVLQREMPIRIWGQADPGEEVTVTLDQAKATAKAGADGAWKVQLDAMKAGGPFELVVTGKNTVTLKNIMIGEVWVCSGQSNMQWIVSSLPSAKDEIAAANFPKIRLFTVPRAVGEPKPYELGKGWAECSPTTVGSFSAVGYFFGRELHKSLDGVAIGLVASSWGGTPCESWTSQAALEANPEFKSILDRYAGQLKEYPEKKKEYDAALAKYEEAVKKATTDGTKPPAKPMAPVGPDSPYRPSGLWSAMIQPLTPMAIRGVIWYQGEANASRGQQYRTLFPAMITDWRKQWGLGDFPFLFVQLANFRERAAQPGESGWAELRDAQLSTLRVPATAMAVAIDIGEAGNIHPANKQDVGKRLCLGALKVAYGRDLVYSGPIYQSMKVEGNKVRLTFAHTGKGLEAKGGELKGFAIAGADKKFVWAKAAIDGQTVVVSADEVAAPVAVRYGWADNPECTLYNADGLPASPFRTDGPTDAK